MAKVVVLGAGMVGTCTAIHLLQRGHNVVLLDRKAPGQETSYGNAGLIQREAVEPHPFPREVSTLLRHALKQDTAVNYHLRDLPQFAAPLWRYWANSGPQSYERILQAYAALIEHSTREHAPMLAGSQAEDLVRRDGYRFIYRKRASFDQGVSRAERLAKVFGLNHTVLDADALASAEPVLQQRLMGAVHWHDTWSVKHPGQLVERYANWFQNLGGHFVLGDAASLSQKGAGWQVRSAEGVIAAEHVVVALGPWSASLVETLGYRYPLFVKRGYHRHYRSPQMPNLAMLDADQGIVLIPMQQGLRITTGAEFANIDAPPTPRQLWQAEALARGLLDLGEPEEAQPWLGARPCTVDMLPVIGKAPKHQGLWFNFGHAHQGFTLGPASGRLLAELLDGELPYLEPTPYAPSRFAD